MKQEPRDFNYIKSEIGLGLTVIEASAGTGKTHAISHLVPRFLLDGTAKHLSEIRVVTFTNAAARELSERIRRTLYALAVPLGEPSHGESAELKEWRSSLDEKGRRILENALNEADKIGVSTINAFCQRTLQSEGVLCGLPAIPDTVMDANDEIGLAVYDLWKNEIASDDLLSAIASAKKWDWEEDQKWVRTALQLDDCETRPPTMDFGKRTMEMRDALSLIGDSSTTGELADFLRKKIAWNISGRDEAWRDSCAKKLASLKESPTAQNMDALFWVAQLPSHINKRTSKSFSDEACGLRAVQLCQNIESTVQNLKWDWQNYAVAAVRERIGQLLASKRQITQDGLIGTLWNALRSPSGESLARHLQERQKVALIDESQDTDPRQFEIFKKLFTGTDSHKLVLIGDPKQAIYSFRGADLNTYLAAKEEATTIYSLSMTYRAPQRLVAGLNAFFARSDSFLHPGMSFIPAKSGLDKDIWLEINSRKTEPVQAWVVVNDADELYSEDSRRTNEIAWRTASEITRLLSDNTARMCEKDVSGKESRRTLKPGDFAVLVRKNSQAEIMSEALKKKGVPSVLTTGTDILKTDEAAELLRILRAVDNPRKRVLRNSALATRMLGNTTQDLAEMRNKTDLEECWIQKLFHWREQWSKEGVSSLLRALDDDAGVPCRLAAMERGERRACNFRQLCDLLLSIEQGRFPTPSGLMRWFSQEITRAGESPEANERQMQLESDADAVQIVTMHKAKGLDYNFVFCPFLGFAMESKDFQVLRKTKSSPKDLAVNVALTKNDETLKDACAKARLEEDLRLAYVAMTRAKVGLWIYAGALQKNDRVSALDWLLGNRDSLSFEQFKNLDFKNGRGQMHMDGLQAIASSAAGSIAVLEPPLPDDKTVVASENVFENRKPAALEFVAKIPTPWTVVSFSSLTREKHAYGAADGTETKLQSETEADEYEDVASPFLCAPGGTLVGTAVHEWIEGWDFSEPDSAQVKKHLGQYAFSVQAKATLCELLPPTLDVLRRVVMPRQSCDLAEICAEPRASEWHFHLPLKEGFSTEALAKVFERFGHAEYADALRGLGHETLGGFLQGFVDRLFYSQGWWGVIDWKTNDLGRSPSDYGDEQLQTCARNSHYFLQAHLYLVALRRHLRISMPKHAPQIAGAYLVFLRGIKAGESAGVLAATPENEMLDALDKLFEGSWQ